jgi:hypothetical protein
MVLFSKDNIAFGSKIVIFFFELVGESHSANFVKLVDFLMVTRFIYSSFAGINVCFSFHIL